MVVLLKIYDCEVCTEVVCRHLMLSSGSEFDPPPSKKKDQQTLNVCNVQCDAQTQCCVYVTYSTMFKTELLYIHATHVMLKTLNVVCR
jgi:hypothetical protein